MTYRKKRGYVAPKATLLHAMSHHLCSTSLNIYESEGNSHNHTTIIEGTPEGDIDAKKWQYNAWDDWDDKGL